MSESVKIVEPGAWIKGDRSTGMQLTGGAKAVAHVTAGIVTSIEIISDGMGYTSPHAFAPLAPFRTRLQNLRKQFSHLPKVLKALDTFEVMGAMAKNPAIEVFNTRIFGPLTALMYQAEPQGPYTFWGEEEDRYYNDAGQPLEMETQSTWD